jgi:hypothetical protein
MPDGKYGRIFTEDDVRSMFEAHEATGHSFDELAQSGEFKFPEDEPLFVFRGQDRKALGALLHYDKSMNIIGIPASHADAVTDSVHAFERFRSENPDRMKLPD